MSAKTWLSPFEKMDQRFVQKLARTDQLSPDSRLRITKQGFARATSFQRSIQASGREHNEALCSRCAEVDRVSGHVIESYFPARHSAGISAIQSATQISHSPLCCC